MQLTCNRPANFAFWGLPQAQHKPQKAKSSAIAIRYVQFHFNEINGFCSEHHLEFKEG